MSIGGDKLYIIEDVEMLTTRLIFKTPHQEGNIEVFHPEGQWQKMQGDEAIFVCGDIVTEDELCRKVLYILKRYMYYILYQVRASYLRAVEEWRSY